MDLDQPDWQDGPPKHNVSTIRDHGTNNYHWFGVQARLNSKFKQFTTTVTAGPNYTYPIPLHFFHHQSPRQDAISLLHIQSSPGSFLGVDQIIDLLTNPPDDTLPAFHVVAYDIPGFGFCPAAEHSGLGLREADQAFNTLMSQRGYDKYVDGGGDFGALALRHVATDFPDAVVSVLSNFYLVFPNATDLQRYALNLTTAMEDSNIGILNANANTDGYGAIQSTTPLQLAVGMTDSPFGTATWIYSVTYEATPGYAWTPEQIITWTMMYYVQGRYGAFRKYKEATAATMSPLEEKSSRICHRGLELTSFALALVCACRKALSQTISPTSTNQSASSNFLAMCRIIRSVSASLQNPTHKPPSPKLG
jgi:hypothetical protein